jgi:galactokinase/mevalonate kinase-like predicted kinase
VAASSAASDSSGSRGGRIVITRAPLRLSLAGAGSDLPSYAHRYGGAAVSATIDHFAYAMVSETGSTTVHVASSDYAGLLEDNDSAGIDSFHRPALAMLKALGIERGVSVFMTSELPPYAGVGAISAALLALAWALARLQRRTMTRDQAASLATAIEVERLGTGGRGAEVYGQAVGGLTFLDATEDGVCATPIRLPDDIRLALEARLMLFFSGRVQRDQRAIDDLGRAADRNRAGVIDGLHEIKEVAIELRDQLAQGNIDALGGCLDRTWQATRRLGPSMTDPWVDQWYEMAVNAGASGGKVNGLGGAGFLLLYCQPKQQQRVTESLQSAGLRRVDVHLESSGVSLLLDESTTTMTARELTSRTGKHTHN